MVSLNAIPSTQRQPGVFIEFDASKAQQGPVLQVFEALLIGQRLSTGSVAEKLLRSVSSADQAGQYFGKGSSAHLMAVAWFAANKSTKLSMIALDDAGGSVAATGTLTIAGTPTAAGTLAVYVDGRRLQIPVATTDTPTTVAAATVTKVNADTTLPVTAANVAGVITFTARNKGTQGNDIDIRVNYADGEFLPTGLTATPTALTGGSGDPDVTTLWTVLGEQWFHIMAIGWNDATTLAALNAELEDRWGPMRQIESRCFFGFRGTHAATLTKGSALNSKHLSFTPANKSPRHPSQWAAIIAGTAALYCNIDPGRQLKGLPLFLSNMAPAIADRYTAQESNLQLFDGASTWTVDVDGTVRIARQIMTYQTNPAGADDTAFLDLWTHTTLGYIRFSARNRFLVRYPRHKLAKDGTRFGSGQAVLTPSMARAEFCALFLEWEELALVEGFDQFKADLVVEINPQNPNFLQALLSPDLINNFVVGGFQIGFLL